jgi:hypothetical protein
MSIRPFNTIEDLFAFEREAQSQANSRIQPFQSALKEGDCFCYLSAERQPNVIIWGEVLPLDPEDIADGYEQDPNYRFTRCHSIACPEGELGDIHVSVVHAVVSRTIFEKARAAGWPHDEAAYRALVATVEAARAVN